MFKPQIFFCHDKYVLNAVDEHRYQFDALKTCYKNTYINCPLAAFNQPNKENICIIWKQASVIMITIIFCTRQLFVVSL